MRYWLGLILLLGCMAVRAAPPFQGLIASPASGSSVYAGAMVDFVSSAEEAPSGYPYQNQWTFGDGGTASGVTVSHAYASPGTYSVSLTVKAWDVGRKTYVAYGSGTVAVTVVAAASVGSFTASPAILTVGESSLLSWSVGAGSTFSIVPTGTTSGTSVAVAPTATQSYTLTARDALGGTATATATVTVVPKAAITSFSSSSASITAGQGVTLSWAVSNAASVSIDGVGAVTGTSLVVSPAATTTYTLRAKNALGREVTQALTVAVVPAAGITSFTSNAGSITAGGSATLSWTVSNAASLSIDGLGAVTGSSLAVSPATTTTYTLRAKNSLGQEAAQSVTVVVVPAAGITSFTSSAGSITAGGSATLSWAVSNAASVSMDGIGAVTGTSLVVSPAVTTTYTLRAKNSLGQEAAQSVTVVVVPAAGITSFTASAGSITAGGSVTLSWAVSNAASVSMDGIGAVTGGSLAVSPVVTTTYTLRAKNSLGQEAAQSVTVVVVPAAGITSFTSSVGSITAGGSATLSWSVSNAASLSIDGIGSVTGSSLAVSPAATTTYTLRAKNSLGQETVSTLTVVVVPAAGITSFTSSAGSITAGGSATLSWAVSNAASLSIDGLGAVTGSSLAVSPAATTTYTLRAKNSLGQEAAQSVTVVVVPAAGITSFTSSPGSITAGGSTTLSWVVSGAASLSIDGLGAVTGSSLAVSPTTTTTYTLRAKNSLGSEVTATAAVTVVAKASLSFRASVASVKPGGSSTLTWEAGGATAVTLDGVSVGVTGSKAVSPTSTTTYTLRATNSLGDASEASVTVEVVPLVLRWVKNIVYVGSKELAEVDAEGIHGVMTDHVGSPRFIVNGQGQVESEQKFLPFGESLTNPAAAAKFGKGFTNHEQTDPSGLIYMQARFYAPWYGRFLSPDPARDQHFEETQSWNIYSYVQNNPTMNIDPTGMWTWSGVYDTVLDGAAKGLTYGKMVPGLGAGIMLGEAASGQRVDTSGNVHQLTSDQRIDTALVGGASLALQVVAAGSPATTSATLPTGVANQSGAAVLQTATVTVPSAAAVAGAAAVPAASAMTGGPTLGQNPKNDVPKGQTNTDLSGGKSTGKSIFRNQTKGQKVTQQTTKDGKTIRTAEDGSKIRFDPAKGKTNVELPNRGIGKENIHLRN